MSAARPLLLASALALAGCSRLSGDGGPQLRSLVPTGGYVGAVTDLRVLGTGFTLRGIQQLSGGQALASTFTVVVGGRSLAATPQATMNGLQVLRVSVPADLPVGVYDVAVQDPYGAWGTLPRAFTMSLGPPPQLDAQLVAASTAELGGSSPATLTVQNTGGVAAQISRIQIDAAFVAASGTLAPGASLPFSISLPATVRGLQPHTVVALGVDSVTGLALSAPPATAQVSVLAPPALTATAHAPPASVDVGQAFSLVVDVTNGGDVAARAVAATPAGTGLVASAAAPAQDVAPGATVTFTLPVSASQAGTLRATAALAGTDAFSNAAVAGSAAWPAILVQTAPALSFSWPALPASVDTGQTFTLKLAVGNAGQALAKGVAPALPAPTSASVPATCTGPSAPASADIAGGASATFSWSCKAGSSAGSLAFQTTASGTDPNTGAALSASGTSSPLTVQTPAALSATLTAPASGNVGDTLNVSLSVSNPGGASASAVTPALTLGGSATGAVASGPTPASATLPGGGNQIFTWTVTLATTGTLQLSATASGNDANTGAATGATAAASVSVGQAESTLLTSTDPFGGDGTNFASIFSYQGQVYLGPDYKSTSTSTTAAPANTQSGAVSMAPDGTNQKSVPWQLEVMVGARNPAYQPATPPPPLCHTIGFLNCKQSTTQCGPDGEGGRALFASGVVNGTEWYMVSGASPLGGANYLYMTNPTFPLAAGGYDDLAYVQIQAGQFGSTRGLTAAHVFGNALYLGFLDVSANGPASQQNAPVLNVLNKMPALPGYVANGGTDIVNLNGVYLPGVGAQGTPPNVGSTSGQLIVDSIADLNGALYVANNGGIARSVGTTIGPCAATGCVNWTNATPVDPAWAAQISVTTTGSDFGGLVPSRRAVPWIVPFGGRLFAVRNTGSGPQIWSCQPSAPVPPDTQPQCLRTDWSLVAPNTAGSLNVQLSQMNDGNNTAATVLAASSSHLYVGFDNSKGGVQLYRLAAPLPAAISVSNFTGRAGCTAGTAGCQGLGGNGLTTPILTQFDDAHAFTYSGNEWIYVSANGSFGGPRIFRLAP